eukprot:15456430-Alexandrium_andersonii.AAC.1
MGTLVMSGKLGSIRCAGRFPMADSAHCAFLGLLAPHPPSDPSEQGLERAGRPASPADSVNLATRHGAECTPRYLREL